MPEAALVLAVFAVGVGGSLLLYRAVRAERSHRETTAWGAAERVARRDTDDDSNRRR